MEDELTKREENKIRRDVAKSVFSEEMHVQPSEVEDNEVIDDTVDDNVAETKEAWAETKGVDPWEGVPAHVRTEIETLRERVKGVDALEAMETRLKQVERRAEAYKRKVEEAEKKWAEAEAAKKNQPTPEQVRAEQEAEDRWNRFKESDEEFAETLEKKLQKEIKRPPTNEELLEALAPELEKRILGKVPNTDGLATKSDLIAFRHPDWESTVQTKEFAEFIAGRPDLQPKCDSYAIADTLAVLNAYEEATKKPETTTETAEQIREKQRRRKEASTTQELGDKAPKKSLTIDNMTPEEARKEGIRRAFAGGD